MTDSVDVSSVRNQLEVNPINIELEVNPIINLSIESNHQLIRNKKCKGNSRAQTNLDLA